MTSQYYNPYKNQQFEFIDFASGAPTRSDYIIALDGEIKHYPTITPSGRYNAILRFEDEVQSVVDWFRDTATKYPNYFKVQFMLFTAHFIGRADVAVSPSMYLYIEPRRVMLNAVSDVLHLPMAMALLEDKAYVDSVGAYLDKMARTPNEKEVATEIKREMAFIFARVKDEKRRRFKTFHEELIATALHPDRVAAWLEGGLDIDSL